MLKPAEQELFARLGVFVDGATLDAVEAVCLNAEPEDEDEEQKPSDEAIDGLGSLLDKSLVRRRDAASGEPRFAMLQTIREYAVERLRADGGLDESRERHASYFAELAEEAEPQLVSADQTQWIERLDDELGNLRAVLQWSQESGRLDVGLRVVGALPRYWSVRGLTDPPRWLAPALEHDADVPASVRAKAQFAHGYAALDHGDFARAEKSFEASMTMYRELDEPRGTAACLAQLAFLRLSRGDSEGAVELAEESVELAHLVNDQHIESVALSTLAEDATRRGEYEHAREMYEQTLELRRELGDRRNIANALLNVGRTELLLGDEKHAREMLEQGLAVGREVGDTWTISVGLASLGRLDQREGRHAEAVGLLRQALELTVERGGKRLAAECLAALGVAASGAAPARSARLFGAAEALRRASGVVLSPIELAAMGESLDAVREALSKDEFRAQFAAGLAMALEDAVTYALSDS